MTENKEIMDRLESLGFDDWQMWEIRYGLEHGLDVLKYADPKLDWIQMNEIRRKLEGKPVAWHTIDLTKFDDYQLFEIGIGLAHGIDVSRYASPEYDDDEMHEIRLSLEAQDESWKLWFEAVSSVDNHDASIYGV